MRHRVWRTGCQVLSDLCCHPGCWSLGALNIPGRVSLHVLLLRPLAPTVHPVSSASHGGGRFGSSYRSFTCFKGCTMYRHLLVT